MSLKIRCLFLFLIFTSGTAFFAMTPELTMEQHMQEIRKTPKVPWVKYLSLHWWIARNSRKQFPPHERLTSDRYDDGPASPEYAKLGKEAQDAVGIPLHEQLPIRKLNPAINGVVAQTELTAIYVNEIAMNSKSYGANRHTMFHEAIHHKKAHTEKSLVAAGELATCVVAYCGLYTLLYYALRKFPRLNSHPIRAIISGLGAVAITILSSKYYWNSRLRKKDECEADTLGAYATQCYNCVRCKAGLRDFEQDRNGYLGKKDLDIIADKLEQENVLCAQCTAHIKTLPHLFKIKGSHYPFHLQTADSMNRHAIGG